MSEVNNVIERIIATPGVESIRDFVVRPRRDEDLGLVWEAHFGFQIKMENGYIADHAFAVGGPSPDSAMRQMATILEGQADILAERATEALADAEPLPEPEEGALPEPAGDPERMDA